MSYIFDFNDLKLYKKWYDDPENGRIIAEQIDLAFKMLDPRAGDTILDIGCNVGVNLAFFIEQGLNATGIEASAYLAKISHKKLGNKARIYKGIFEDLPFEDNSFDYSTLITTLEFVEDPVKTVREACRVTKDKIFIGILNKYAVKNIERRIKGIFSDTFYKKARFFAIWEINNIIKSSMGDIPIKWGTTYHALPITDDSFFKNELSEAILRKNPFGAFAGILAVLKPTFRTTPLKLKHLTKQTAGV